MQPGDPPLCDPSGVGMGCGGQVPGRRVCDLDAFTFWLGIHKPQWLPLLGVPSFVSRRTLHAYLLGKRRHEWCRGVCIHCKKSRPARGPLGACERSPRAIAPWVLDSGGFTELQLYGKWLLTAKEYVEQVKRFVDLVGAPAWVAPRDWMCEPIIRKGGKVGDLKFAGTGLSVAEHQRRTVEDFLELRDLLRGIVRVTPVVQGWTMGDYLDCVELYDKLGVDLREEPVVGVGSICRRQGTIDCWNILHSLWLLGLALHAFGLKVEGLQMSGDLIASADSLTWSRFWRHRLIDGHDQPGPGRPFGHANCANCMEAALLWLADLMDLPVTEYRKAA